MPKTTKVSYNTKHTFILCLVLFALSPCIVKDALFEALNLTYTKPLNKAKSANSTNACQYTQKERKQLSIVKRSKIIRQTAVFTLYAAQHFTVRTEKACDYYAKNFSGNSPPEYILYKRMKIGIA